MIGVVAHLTGNPAQAASDHRADYLYSRFRDTGPSGGLGWLALAAQAGIRHVRCDTGGGVVPSSDAGHLYALETMRLLDSVKPAFSPPYVTGIDKTYLSTSGLATDLPVLRAAAGRIWMIEGPDESWPPNGKFLPSFVTYGDSRFLCTHAMACVDAMAPPIDPGHWLPVRDRGTFDPTVVYHPGDLVGTPTGVWVAPPGYQSPAGTAPGDSWLDVTGATWPSFSAEQPGIYYGYEDAGELGVAWGEYIAAMVAADNVASADYWSSAGRYGQPTRVATWSEGGMDVYFWWGVANGSVLARYQASMPGGATNVHLYSEEQPSDLPAVCQASLQQASVVLPGYPVYLGEIGQATYPTDDALALGRSGSTPTSVMTTSDGHFPADQLGRPMPGSSTARFGPELAQAQLLTRTWAEMFSTAPSGSRLAIYELLNEPFGGYRDYTGEWGYPSSGGPFLDYDRSEGNFGLLRSDLSPKPAFVAIANVCQLMGDVGDQNFVPADLTFYLSRSDSGQVSAQPQYGAFDEIRTVLCQGSDGVFRIPVWYVNVHATDELLPGMRLSAMTAPAPTEWVTLNVSGPKPRRIEAYNTQVSATRPQVVVHHQLAITWQHTPDLWIVKVYP